MFFAWPLCPMSCLIDDEEYAFVKKISRFSCKGLSVLINFASIESTPYASLMICWASCGICLPCLSVPSLEAPPGP